MQKLKFLKLALKEWDRDKAYTWSHELVKLKERKKEIEVNEKHVAISVEEGLEKTMFLSRILKHANKRSRTKMLIEGEVSFFRVEVIPSQWS